METCKAYNNEEKESDNGNTDWGCGCNAVSGNGKTHEGKVIGQRRWSQGLCPWWEY